MKILLYTTTNCQFSKQEKDYLASHSLAFEEKNLDTNKQFLTEMMTLGNNFAGTPVTRIEKDDGTFVVLKGFTVEEFNAALGLTEPATPTDVKPPEAAPVPGQEASMPTVDSTPTVGEPAPAISPMPETVAPTTPAAPPANPAPDAPLNDVLSQIENKLADATKPADAPSAIPTVESPASTAPTVPPADTTPAIPDFPADAATQPVK
jgi:glutaredoxin